MIRHLLGILLAVVIVTACASFAEDLEKVPALENRTLWIADDFAGFYYPWRECVKRGIFGGCRKWEQRVDKFDLNDEAVRAKLKAMGFVAKVRERVVQ